MLLCIFRMGSALLSRFDLVFILLDKPDEEMDAMLSEHVMALHAGRKRYAQWDDSYAKVVICQSISFAASSKHDE